MSKPRAARLVTLCLLLLTLVMLAVTSRSSNIVSSAGNDLVVHEWGTFTSVAGKDGVTLEWRPFTFESDLPSFVHSIDKSPRPGPQQPSPQPAATPRPAPTELRYPSKSGTRVLVRMETPILYFYAKEETAVKVKVDFPGGRITEWYPQAHSINAGSIDWGAIKISPEAHFDLPNDFQDNHYYPARDTDAAPLQVSAEQQFEHEKFLFYRGVGNFDLPLAVKLQGDQVVLKNARGGNICKIVIFEKRGDKIGYLIREMPQTEIVLTRPVLDGKVESLRQEMKTMLISQGLYEKEADAMLNTWRDSWFEEGLRIFYIMPRQATDAILPLAIEPQPRELVRVLVGRAELITPEMEVSVGMQIRKLDDPSNSVRQAALKEINKYGRFREFILTQVLQHTTDKEIRSGVERLLQQRS